MGGNDLDALPFEFGCDFGSFEDKYFVPPLSTRMAALSHEAGGFDILPPLSASLLSPSTNFQLGNTPSPSPSLFLHYDHDRINSAESRGGHHMLKRKSDAAFPIEVPTLCANPFKYGRPSSSSSLPVDDEPSESDPSFTPSTSASSAKSTHIGRWTKREHELFLEGLKLYGKSWKKISSLVITRTLVQIRTHAQKYLQKQSKSALKAANAAAAAASAGDNDFVGSNKVDRQPQRFGQHLGDHLDAAWMGKGSSGFAPISFPDLLQAPASSSSLPHPRMSALSRSSSPYILPALAKKEASSSLCKLDQLLQDEPHYLSSSMDANGYYQSPMGTDEEILQHPMYAQWSRTNPHDTTASSSSTASAYLPTKRRRLDHLMPVPSSHHQQQQQQHLVNPMEAMAASSSDAQQMSLYGLGPPHVFGSMDFNHQQQLHPSFTSGASHQFVDSSNYGSVNYGNWQLP